MSHFWGHRLAYGLPLATLLAVASLVTFEINLTESLQGTLFVVVKTQNTIGDLKRGGYVTYRWQGGARIPKGIHFTKIVRGLPGDEVAEQQREFFVNGLHSGTAKPEARGGWMKLDTGPTGRIPDGRIYVYGTHPDSLDSRYSISGWIPEGAIVGRAYKVF
jgi:conjugal transfer pilin signal peptidase TrbI